MASELEPELQATDRSLLDCSAEEIAGVSAWTWAGMSGPGRCGWTRSWKSWSCLHGLGG